MMDLVLWASTKADLVAFAKAQGIFDDDGNVKAHRFDYTWWAGSGKFMTAPPVLDGNGDVTTPATFLAGWVVTLRIYTTDDAVPVEDLDEGEDTTTQWVRSQVARHIKTNGTPGTTGGIPHYELDNVKLFRFQDVFDWCASHNVPPHEWVGGNQG